MRSGNSYAINNTKDLIAVIEQELYQEITGRK
jgi:hypothetical protein